MVRASLFHAPSAVVIRSIPRPKQADIVVDMMIIPDVLCEVVFAFETVGSSVLPTVCTWEAWSILSMLPHVSLIRVQARKLLFAIVMLTTETQVSCL